MKTLLTTLLAALALTLNAAEPEKKYYRDFEFQIDSFYATSTPDFEQETGSAGLGINVFISQNFGIGVSTALTDLNGQFIDSVSLRGIYRVPINRSALYGYGGTTRLIKAEEWTIDLGVGGEHRFTPNLSPFVEIGMQKQINHGAEAIGKVGARISF